MGEQGLVSFNVRLSRGDSGMKTVVNKMCRNGYKVRV